LLFSHGTVGMHARPVHLLFIRGDGSRVVRVDVARALRVIVAVLVVAALAVLGLVTRGALGRVGRTSLVAPALAAPATDAATVARRLAEMRAEVMGWRALHVEIWGPLGPDGERRATGMGGGTPTGVGGGTSPGAPARTVTLDEQVAELADSLVAERQRLHTLAAFMAGRGALLRAMPMRWPVRGSVNSEFGRRLSPWTGTAEFHGGIDIAAAPGTPVKAPAGGRVVFAGASPGYGVTVIVEHVREVKTLFGHLRDTAVSVGQRVEAGQRIASTGESGRTTGPHLHYEISVRGQPVDPRGYLWD
jgi:murein DD-endopeptidase MepM/ murein hydrolase activator NlpD